MTARAGWAGWARRSVAAGAALPLVAALPYVVAAVVALGVVWHPVSDWALIEVQTADVSSTSPPLVGAYSRFGFDHPGPLAFWLLAPLYQAAGRAPSALLAGSALIGAVAAAGAVVTARRCGGRTLATLVAVAMVLTAALLGGSAIVNPWNPALPFVPFLWFAVLAWAVAVGRTRCLPLLVATGSLAVQSHLAYAPPVVAVFAVAVGLGLRARPLARPWGGAAGRAVGVGALLWALPVWDQIHGEGNLGRIAASLAGDASAGSGGRLGWAAGLGVFGRVTTFGDAARVVAANDSLGPIVPGSAIVGLAVLAVVVALAAAAWRFAPRPIAAAATVDAAAALAMVAGAARAEGYPFPWLFRPMLALPVWTAVVVAWWVATRPAVRSSAASAWRRSAGGLVVDRCVAGTTLVTGLLLVGAVGAGPRAASVEPPWASWSDAAGRLCPPAADALAAEGTGAVVLDLRPSADLLFLTFACAAAFTRAGIDVRVGEGQAAVFLPGHGPRHDGGVAPKVSVAVGPVEVAAARAKVGARVVVALTPSVEERRAGVPDAAVVVAGLGFT